MRSWDRKAGEIAGVEPGNLGVSDSKSDDGKPPKRTQKSPDIELLW